MKWRVKRELFALGMIALTLVATVIYASILPETVATHFNAQGIPDGWSSKSTLLLFGVAIPVALYLVVTFIPMIDPFWQRIQAKYDLFLLFRDVVMGFAAYMTVVEYVSAQQGKFQVGMFGFGFGLLFILLGNYLPKLPRNFFFGIRSPWTLASETVWKRTHILSGWLFVAAGCLMAGLSFTSIPFHILLLALILPLALFSAVIYPYYLYRKIQKGGGGNLPEL